MDLFILPKNTEMTPEILQGFIDSHKARLPRYNRLKALYESQAPILSLPEKAEYKPDNRLVVNYAKYITDTFNGYFIGIPIKVSHEDATISDAINAFMVINDMADNDAELSKMMSIYGHAYELVYQDEETNTRCIYNSPLDMFVIYDNTIEQRPMFGVRYMVDDEGNTSGSVYTAAKIVDFVTEDKKLAFAEEKAHFYGEVPIIEYIENEERQSIFESVETLINAFDKALSEKANDVDYFADAYLKIFGVELDEDGIQTIRDNRIINLFGNENLNAIVADFMDKPNGDGTQEHLLDRIERLIYQISMVSNINDESFGQASGVALEFKLQPMKNLAATKERKFTSGMNRRFRMLFRVLGVQGMADPMAWINLEYGFTRNIPRNTTEEAEVAAKLAGIVSRETQLKGLSIVDNVQDEMDRMDAELESQVSIGFNLPTGDPNPTTDPASEE